MNLELAIVESCGPEGCQVKMVSDGRELYVRYSELVLGRVKIRPTQMVAIDLDPVTPEIVWRWYRVPVAEVTQKGAILDDRGARQMDAVVGPGIDMDLHVGDPVFVTGMEGTWEIHAKTVEGVPLHPERIGRLVMPRIVESLSTKTMG